MDKTVHFLFLRNFIFHIPFLGCSIVYNTLENKNWRVDYAN